MITLNNLIFFLFLNIFFFFSFYICNNYFFNYTIFGKVWSNSLDCFKNEIYIDYIAIVTYLKKKPEILSDLVEVLIGDKKFKDYLTQEE